MPTFLPSSVTILYGSETGNAHDYAQYLSRRLQYYQLQPTLAALDDYPLKQLVTKTLFLIILCSTTGQGELPRRAKRFLRFLLRKKLPSDLLNHLKITTFGLGDSSYPKFNYAIKKLHARLLQLGCEELLPRCEADEQSPEGIDGFYTEWETALVAALKNHFPELVTLDDNVLLPPEYPISVDEKAPVIVTSGQDERIALTRTAGELSVATVAANSRITAEDHFQDVRHVIFEAEDLTYAPGDTLALYPVNDKRNVELLFELQPHWLPLADQPLLVEKLPVVEGGYISNETLTLRSLITHHLDIMAIPRRLFFMVLWHFVDESTEDGAREKEKLREFSRFEESEDLYNYANRPRRLILETIMEFEKNLRIPVEYVLDLFPVIKPRLFLIASRPSATLVELVVAVVEYKTILRRIRRGLCTKWLKSLQKGDKVLYFVHKSNLSFALADGSEPPIIMVAPGTGVAPMKSLIEQQVLSRGQDLHLFFGCRYKEKDYLFRELWQGLEAHGQLHLYPCFSRDPGSPSKYVQHSLFAQKEKIGDLILHQKAIVFVCGSSGNMPREVRISLIEILVSAGLERAQADAFLLEMEDSGRYIQETW